MFGWLFGEKTPAKKSYPALESSMLQPLDAPISTTEAKKIYREWMLKIGYLDKQEIGDHVKCFAEEMRDHEGYLKDEVQSAKDEMTFATKDLKAEVKALKQKVADHKGEASKEDLMTDLADIEDELNLVTQDCQGFIDGALEALNAFKADKRQFLIGSVNQQTQL